MFTLTLLYTLSEKYSCKLMKNGKECQIIVGNVLFFANKILDIPIHNSNYMPWVPNETLTNDGNVPGITL